MILIDAHQDLAYNMLNYGRDYTRSAAETRRLEKQGGSAAPFHNGNTLLGWPDYQKGRVAIIFATLFSMPFRKAAGPWEIATYRDIDEAHRRYMDQVDLYHRLTEEHPDLFKLLQTRPEMEALLEDWQSSEDRDDPPPVGLVILMEGAEGVREPSELDEWWSRGVRMIGPAWVGNRFCGGTGETGPLTGEGRELLEGMAGLGFTLDISHMDEQAAMQALDIFEGPVLASHANAAALLKGAQTNRHLPDRVIHGLVERDAVIGVVPYNSFLKAGWKKSDGRQDVTLAHVFSQIDHICQLAGDSTHVGIGSDFDGGFGLESVPEDIDTIADLNKLAGILEEHGYDSQDIAAVLGLNWRRMLDRVLPESA